MIAVIKDNTVIEVLNSDSEVLTNYNLKINTFPVTINGFTFNEVVKPSINNYQKYSNNVTMVNGVPTQEVVDMSIEEVRSKKTDEVHKAVASTIDGMAGTMNDKLISLTEMVLLMAKVSITGTALSTEEETRAGKLLADGVDIKAIITARDNALLEIETENNIEVLKTITYNAPA